VGVLFEHVAGLLGQRLSACHSDEVLAAGDCPACGRPTAIAWAQRRDRRPDSWRCWWCRSGGSLFELHALLSDRCRAT
jgi:hypothetical protein